MTDANLRELERRFRASGSVEDEAAWLWTRVQTGDLARSQLELAAHLGHPAAALGTGVDPLPARFESDALTPGASPRSAWDDWLLRYPLEATALRRLSLAIATVAYRTYLGERVFGDAEWVTEEFWALEDALLRAADEYALQGEGALSAAFEARGTPSQLPAEAVASAAAAFRTGDRAELLLAAAKAALPRPGEFRALLAAELTPWALGATDPVRERVAVRLREAAGE